jgi:probable F420-dependent oxidoreductase
LLGLPTDDVARREEFGTVEALGEMARTVESSGYDGVFVTDHPMPPESFIRSGGHHALEPTVALAVVAAATTSLRLMTNLYVLAYRNPFLAAKAIASLDSLSGGRVIFGTGAGYLEPEFRALGADFDARNDRLDEAIDLIKAAWTGEPVDAVGVGFEARGNVALPMPVQVPHPPIWIGGNSRRALRRAAERGDGWLPMPAPKKFAKAVRSAPLETLTDLARMLDTLREESERLGREVPPDVMFGPIGIASYGTPEFDASAYLDQVAELERLGVTSAHVMFSHPGHGGIASRAEFLELAEGFARDVGIARRSS